MKRKGLAKLKYNIWFYFILFSLIITIITWVFQILLFDIIYQKRRFDTLESMGGELSKRLNTELDIDEEPLLTGFHLQLMQTMPVFSHTLCILKMKSWL